MNSWNCWKDTLVYFERNKCCLLFYIEKFSKAHLLVPFLKTWLIVNDINEAHHYQGLVQGVLWGLDLETTLLN